MTTPSDDASDLFAPTSAPVHSAELAAYEEPEQQLLYDTDTIKSLMQQSLDVFGSVVAPDEVSLTFPDFYSWLFLKLVESLLAVRDFSKFAIGLPRGHGKTFVVKLLLVYVILFTRRRYILVIGANSAKAEAIIKDVCSMLRSANVVKLFGDYTRTITKDTQSLKQFAFNGRTITLEAAGQGTSIRGSNHDNARPDVILCDDVQTRAGAKSVQESKEFHTWFTGDLMKAKSPTGCTYIYIGNMYKDVETEPGSGVYNCMLRNLERSPNWISMVVGAILSDGEALWEELQPLQQLLEEYESDTLLGQAEVFFAEVLNDPRGVPATAFNPAKLKTFVKTPGMLHQGSFICIDPATSKATPDQMVISYHEMYDDRPVAIEIDAGKYTGPQSVHVAIDMALRNQCSLIAVESVAYQYTLCEWLRLVLEQRGIHGIRVEPIAHRGQSKNSAIMRFFLSCNAGEYMVTNDTRSKIVSQALIFDPTKTTNVDDIIDCGAMAVSVGLNMRHLMTIEGFSAEDTPHGLPQHNEVPYAF